MTLSPCEDRAIAEEIVLGDAAHEGERALEAALGQIVEEETADAAGLGAVREEEIFIARLLVARVELGAERVPRGLRRAVPMNRIFLEAVVGRQIKSATEPPCGFLAVSC